MFASGYGEVAKRGERDRFHAFSCVLHTFSRPFLVLDSPPETLFLSGIPVYNAPFAYSQYNVPRKYSTTLFRHDTSAWLPRNMLSSPPVVFLTCNVPAEMCQGGQFPSGGKSVPTFPPIAVSNARLFPRENSPKKYEILKGVSAVAPPVLLAALRFPVVRDLLCEIDA